VIGDSDMRMNRRKVLTALGGITIGGGALFGTGAFSTVSAERTVSVAVDDDSSGVLALDPENGSGTPYSSASSINNNTLELQFDSFGDSSAGLNLDATTTFDPIFRVVNNSENTVDVSITSEGETVASPPTVFSSGPVIQNSLEDTNTDSATIEYKFTDSAETPSSIVGDVSAGDTSFVSVSSNGGTQEIGLKIGTQIDGSSFDPGTASGYISNITVIASDST
jgi:hypothetical protein